MNLGSHRKLQTVGIWLVTVFFVGIVLYFVSSDKEKLAQILSLQPRDLLLLFSAWLLLSIPRALIQKVTANKLGVMLEFRDWYGLSMVTNLLNMLLPARADYLFSAAYLRRKYKMPLSRFGSMVYGNAVLLALMLAIEGMIGLLLLGWFYQTWNFQVGLIVLGLGIGTLPFLLLSSKVVRGDSWLAQRLRTALSGWEILRADATYLLKMVALIAFSSASFMLWMYISYRALNFEIRLIPLLLVAVTTQMSFFFSLTPGNLGLREAVVGFISSLTGLGFAEGVAITLLQRAISTVAFLIVGGIFGIFMWRDFWTQHEVELNEH